MKSRGWNPSVLFSCSVRNDEPGRRVEESVAPSRTRDGIDFFGGILRVWTGLFAVVLFTGVIVKGLLWQFPTIDHALDHRRTRLVLKCRLLFLENLQHRMLLVLRHTGRDKETGLLSPKSQMVHDERDPEGQIVLSGNQAIESILDGLECLKTGTKERLKLQKFPFESGHVAAGGFRHKVRLPPHGQAWQVGL